MAACFLTSFTWTLLATMLVAAVAIAVPKLVAVHVDSVRWPWFWLAGAVVLAVVLAALWTKLTGGGPLDAAIEIDRRCHLRERASSCLALRPEDRQTAAGQALVADAARAVGRIDVAEHFRLGLSRMALLPLLPVMVAFLLVLLVNDRVAVGPATAGTADGATEQIKKSTDLLRRKLIERRRQARQEGLKEADQLLRKLEQGTRQLQRRKHVDKKTALVQLNDLARQLEKRRREIGGDRSLRKHFAQFKKLGLGPAGRLAQALRNGDFRRAAEEVKKLQQQMHNGKLDARGKARLAAQLAAMEKKLRALAAAHQAAMDRLQKQIERARDAGDLAAAQQLQQALDKLAATKPEMNRLAELAAQLGACGQCLGKGNGKAAPNALGQLAARLQAMQRIQDEVAILDDALAQIAACKGGMACAFCGGAGCSHCQGAGGRGAGGRGVGGRGAGGRGVGLGAGRGHGPRPEEKTNTNFYDSQVRQEPGRGRAVVTDLVDGPNVKGRVLEAIAKEFQSGARAGADPLADRRLPRTEREHAQEFFDRFRQGHD